MTKCNESISINNNFEVVQMDGKVFFKAFPDFPIYDETWLPKCVWAQMDLNMEELMKTAVNYQDLNTQYQRLVDKFKGFNSKEKYDEHIKKLSVSDAECVAKYDKLMKLKRHLTEEERAELRGLHYFIKYVVEGLDEFQIFYDIGYSSIYAAIYDQGYCVDSCVGVITKVT